MRLDDRRLNRATLARQSLSRRTDAEVTPMIERIGGLQAQEPATPYIALWTRIEGFDPLDLSQALQERRLVKAALHRSTLHLTAAADYPRSITALTSVLRTKWMNESRGRPVKRSLPELAEAAMAYADVPRTNGEMREFASTLGEPAKGDELWRRIRRYGRFIAVPDDSVWSFGRHPVHAATRSWLEGEPLDDERSLSHVVRTHLRAFGPARLADVAQWSGLGVQRLARGLPLIEDLEHHENERGDELLDLAGAPLPEADADAPARLLPMWDETLLAYQDRSRLLPDGYRKRVIAPNGDVLPTFILDGHVAGLWWPRVTSPDARPRIAFEPFASISAKHRRELEAEGERLATFLTGREADVYARYRR